jgi:hypothetical protein
VYRVIQLGDEEVSTTTDFMLYGMVMIADPEYGILYRKEYGTGGPRVFMMLAIFSDTPAVQKVDLSGYTGTAGDEISICLKGNEVFAMKDVRVKLADISEGTLEQGRAEPAGDGNCWLYRTTEQVKVGTIVRMTVSVG